MLDAELVGQLSDCEVRTGSNAVGGDTQRQWQMAAEPGQVRGGIRLGGGPARADDLDEQAGGLCGGKHIEGYAVGAVMGGEAGQPVTACDDHQAGCAAGEQRADLVSGGGVVQQDEHALARQHAAEHCGLLGQAGRNSLRVDGECAQQVIERFVR